METAQTITLDLPPLRPDLAAALEDVRFELVDGELKERPMGQESAEVGLNVAMELKVFLRHHPVGYAVGADGGYRCFPDRPQLVRKPDASFVSWERNGSRQRPRGWSPVPAELAVEVISPNDVHSELVEKVRDYLANGFDEVWIASPDHREIEVRTASSAVILRADDFVEGRGPLAGLRFRVGDVFPQ